MDPLHVRRMAILRRHIAAVGNGFAWHHELAGWMVIEGWPQWV